ncbi:MAG TPA: hypothetical protein VIC86_02135 [Acidimicrobiales bacterium]|jgi:hypothetical protein
MKWIWVILLVIIGALAAFVAIEYFTVSIHSLPSYIPGHKAAHGHYGGGHYRKRGAAAAVVAFVALGAAGYLTYRNLQGQKPAAAGPATQDSSSVDQLISSPPSEPGGPVEG